MTRKMVCKVSTGEVFIKIMDKVVQAELGTGARQFWKVLGQFPAMGRGKAIEKQLSLGNLYYRRVDEKSNCQPF
jgi:hypothetical protein